MVVFEIEMSLMFFRKQLFLDDNLLNAGVPSQDKIYIHLIVYEIYYNDLSFYLCWFRALDMLINKFRYLNFFREIKLC